MRLSAAERRAVENASRETLPAGTRVLLFGSRLDDSRRGGDIDLLVELPGPLSADDTVAAGHASRHGCTACSKSGASMS